MTNCTSEAIQFPACRKRRVEAGFDGGEVTSNGGVLLLRQAAPGLPEAVWFESRSHVGLLQHGVVAFLGFSRRDIADRLQQPPVIEPVDPFEGSIFDSFE